MVVADETQDSGDEVQSHIIVASTDMHDDGSGIVADEDGTIIVPEGQLASDLLSEMQRPEGWIPGLAGGGGGITGSNNIRIGPNRAQRRRNATHGSSRGVVAGMLSSPGGMKRTNSPGTISKSERKRRNQARRQQRKQS